jgi:hypothetical protein
VAAKTSAPGWVTERLVPTVSGSLEMFWTVLVFRNGYWRVYICSTNGGTRPHTQQAVRNMVETIYGKCERMAVCGPYYDRSNAHGIERKIYQDDEFAVNLAGSAF